MISECTLFKDIAPFVHRRENRFSVTVHEADLAVFKPQNQNSVDFADETNFSGDAVAVRIIHRVGAVLADNVPLAEVGNSVDALQQNLVALAAQRFLVDVPVPPVGQETDVFAGWQRQQRFLGVFFKEAKFAVADAAEISVRCILWETSLSESV